MSHGRLYTISMALGATTICTLCIVSPLISPSHNAIYHWSGTASAIFIPTLIDFIAFWLVLSVLLLFAPLTRRFGVAVWSGITFFLPWVAIKNAVALAGRSIPHWISRGLFSFATIGFILVIVIWKPAYQDHFERLQRRVGSILCVLAFWGVVILGELLWFGLRASHLNAAIPLHQTSYAVQRPQKINPRIIWILFDELSFQQVYGARYQSLQLPAFDALARQSAVFQHVIPAGNATQVVMPSLFSGVPIDKLVSAADGRSIRVHRTKDGQWEPFDQHATVFADALHVGYKTGVAGWYNPYCRLIPEVLDRCSWALNGAASSMMLPHASIFRNVFQPLLLLVSLFEHAAPVLTQKTTAEDLAARQHIDDYRTLVQQGDELLRDTSTDFVLLHMPVPHPGGIYNRNAKSFALHATYLDNLVLADAYLDHVRTILTAQGTWDSSAVFVMGDHSWRTNLMWASGPGWTEEEQIASHGGLFDNRPAYVVKLPGEREGVRVNESFRAVNTRRLLDAVMRRQLTTADRLEDWIRETGQVGG